MDYAVYKQVAFFARYGYANGSASAVKKMLTAGVGFNNVFGYKSDTVGIGASWGRSHDDIEQYALEAYYGIQLTPRFNITPDVQLIMDPVSNPDENVIGYFGVRGRLHF